MHPPRTQTHPATTQTNTTTRTLATGKNRDSRIRQRRGCKKISSYAEDRSAPSSRHHIEDVNNIGGISRIRTCRRHETCTRHQHNPHTPHSCIPLAPKLIMQKLKRTQQHVLVPPAKIATPAFGSDVAARSDRATLRAAVLQAPFVTLKMSVTLQGMDCQDLTTAEGMRLAHVINTPHTHPTHACILIAPNPILQQLKQTTTRTTRATGKNRDSRIRQRRGCKIRSSYAEDRSAPSSRHHVKDVNNIGVCRRHETCTHHQHTTHTPHSCIPLAPKPILQQLNTTNTTTRTRATSEDRDSRIRQRCGCKTRSSLAEGRSFPSSNGVRYCDVPSTCACDTAQQHHCSHSSSSAPELPRAALWAQLHSLWRGLHNMLARASVGARVRGNTFLNMMRQCCCWRWEGRSCSKLRAKHMQGWDGGGGRGSGKVNAGGGGCGPREGATAGSCRDTTQRVCRKSMHCHWHSQGRA
jgi:hypothetical protein